MTEEEKVLANKIYTSIQVIITPELAKELREKNIDPSNYTHEEKKRQTTEKLKERGINV